MTSPRPTDDSIHVRVEPEDLIEEPVWRPGPVVRVLARTATGRVLLDRVARSRVAIRLGLVVHRRRGTDPFRTLEVQRALTRLDAEMYRLRHPADRTFAPNHHLTAAIAAYELALDDACRLAGIQRPAGRGERRRLRTELELRSLGWHW